MSHPLSLQPNVDCLASKTNQRLQPGRTHIRDIPLALIKYAMSFLPFDDLMYCQRVSKLFKTDVCEWTKNRGILDTSILLRYFRRASGKEPIAEIRKMAPRIHEINLEGVALQDLTGLFARSTESSHPAFPYVRKMTISLYWLGSAQEREATSAMIRGDIAFHIPTLTSLRITDSFRENFKPFFEVLLRAYPNLEVLLAEPCVATELDIAALCPKLKKVDLSCYGDNLKKVPKGFQLSTLRIESPSDENLRHLEGHSYLEYLSIREDEDGDPRLSNAAIISLAKIPRLKSLYLALTGYDGDLVDKGITDLSPLNGAMKLTNLTLHAMGIVNIHYFLNTLPRQIETLDFQCCDLFQDQDFEFLWKCEKLSDLTIRSYSWEPVQYTDQGVERLASCKQLRSLTIVHSHYPFGGPKCAIRNEPRITTGGLAGLSKLCCHLRVLDLENCNVATVNADEVEAALADTRPALFVKKNRSERKA